MGRYIWAFILCRDLSIVKRLFLMVNSYEFHFYCL